MATEESMFKFQVHHIFPTELYRNFQDLLTSVGIDEEMKGNKIALLENQTLVDKFKAAPDAFKNLLWNAGWGINRHFGSHDGRSFREQRCQQIWRTSHDD